jgi:hypothetical protein
MESLANIRVLLDTKFTKSCPCIVFSVISMSNPFFPAFLRSQPAILGQILPIRKFLTKNRLYTEVRTNLEEARRNPDKLTEPLSRQKVPFRDQGSPVVLHSAGLEEEERS